MSKQSVGGGHESHQTVPEGDEVYLPEVCYLGATAHSNRIPT